jgi:hypothetical protein
MPTIGVGRNRRAVRTVAAAPRPVFTWTSLRAQDAARGGSSRARLARGAFANKQERTRNQADPSIGRQELGCRGSQRETARQYAS